MSKITAKNFIKITRHTKHTLKNPMSLVCKDKLEFARMIELFNTQTIDYIKDALFTYEKILALLAMMTDTKIDHYYKPAEEFANKFKDILVEVSKLSLQELFKSEKQEWVK